MIGHRLPTVAAIVTTRDRPALLAAALESVAAQRHAPAEVRIADDGTLPIEAAVSRHPWLELTVLPVDVGCAAAARNLAARDARAEVLAFLDDDDVWLPDHLEGLAAAFRAREVAVAFRDAAIVQERVAEDGRRVELARRTIARDWDLGTMRRDSYVAPSALAIRRDRFEALGGFDEGFAYSEDWDLLLRAAVDTTPLRVPGVTVEVRLRDGGAMPNVSGERGAERRACLERLAARHGLEPIAIKTFWEVAADVAESAR